MGSLLAPRLHDVIVLADMEAPLRRLDVHTHRQAVPVTESADPAALLNRAQALGYDLVRPHRVILARP